MRYAPPNWLILVHVITERYDNNVEHGTFAQYSMLHEDEENIRDKRWEIVQEREWRIQDEGFKLSNMIRLIHYCFTFLKKPNAKGRSGPSLRMLSTKKTRKENKDPKTLLSESHLWRMKHTKVVRDLVRLHHKNHLQVQRGFLFKK